ncbi:MAG: T9SS type A sorting domain-containing protein [Bacteroidales bacterium]|nr:T9SS type A sorting domain-containing protein [Bacteroidales bacterium]
MKNIFTLLFMICVPVALFSQAPEYSWRYYRPGNTGIQGDNATALWVDESGYPYIAANTGNWGEGGFAKFNEQDNLWTNFSNVDYPILGSFDNADVQIMDIVEDYDHNLWMGNFTGALKFNPQSGIAGAEQFNAGNSALQGFTYDVDLAPDSTLWFTSGGLVRYNPKTSQWSTWEGSNTRIAVQPKPDGSYLVWSADTYFGYVYTYNSLTNQYTYYTPEAIGDVAGLPGKDCVDDAGNFWAVRMSFDGNWETLEYQRPDGTWVYPTPPYENVSYYIDAFKAYGNGKALLVTTTGETWQFDGTTWHNYGTWRPGEFTSSVDTDLQGNVWVCGTGGAAKRDVVTGNWQRYRITNTSQIDYFVGDFSFDTEGNVWMTGNAGSGVGGFQKFDGSRWTGFNEFTYGLGHPFPYQADNTQAIYARPSNGDVVFNPTFNGIHAWDGTNYFALEADMTTSKGFTEDSQGRIWSLGEYYNIRYYDESVPEWITVPIVGWGLLIKTDPTLPGTIWASTDYEILRTDGVNSLSLPIENFPGSGAWFTGLAIDNDGIMWTGTWSQFTSTGSTLIRYDSNTGLYRTWSYDEGWPFPGEHLSPLAISPDGKVWMAYGSEYPSTVSGILSYDGVNIEVFPSSPGGIPQWGGLPNANIKDIKIRETTGGYELWMSCMGRGMAVLDVVTDPVGIAEKPFNKTDNNLSVWPNPATDKVEIAFNSEIAGQVQLAVYDLQGRLVKELISNNISRGSHTISWDLTGQGGSRVVNGVYIARLSDTEQTETIKIVVK